MFFVDYLVETLTPFSQNEMLLDGTENITIVHVGREPGTAKRSYSSQKPLINQPITSSSSMSIRSSRQNPVKKLPILTSPSNISNLSVVPGVVSQSQRAPTPQSPELVVSNSMTSLLSPNNSSMCPSFSSMAMMTPTSSSQANMNDSQCDIVSLAQSLTASPSSSSAKNASPSSPSSSSHMVSSASTVPTVINSVSISSPASAVDACLSSSTTQLLSASSSSSSTGSGSAIASSSRRASSSSSQLGAAVVTDHHSQKTRHHKREHRVRNVSSDTVQIPLKCDPRTISRL